MESEVGLTASPVGISRGTGCRTKEVVSDDCSCSSSVGIGLAYIIHSGFISGYQNRYGDNLKPPTNVYHRMTA